MKNKVVITGLGVVSSIGIGVEEFWKNLIAGKSGISKVETFDTSNYDRHYGGEVKNFDPFKFMTEKRAKSIGRSSQMAIAASMLAIKDAGLRKKEFEKLKAGVCMGTTMGEPQIMESQDEISAKKGEKVKYDFFSSFAYPANAISNNIAYYFGCKGKNLMFSNACASGNYGIGLAFDQIVKGNSEIMFAGGSDALSKIAFTGFSRLFNMSPDICSPFDVDRKGMMLSEGAGVLLLESLEHAKKRNANIYAEICGYGLSCDATHMTNPDENGIAKAMEKAIKNAHVKKEDIGYICAHGTGTKENDKTESKAINLVFNKEMQDLRFKMQDKSKKHLASIYVSSIKSMLGHTMGAASAIEAISCCLSIKNKIIPPTINLKNQDPECEVNVVANKSQEADLNVVLNNSSAFGGNNCCVVLKEV